jgi:hypothetical protein
VNVRQVGEFRNSRELSTVSGFLNVNRKMEQEINNG